jgi:hypothetical protein
MPNNEVSTLTRSRWWLKVVARWLETRHSSRASYLERSATRHHAINSTIGIHYGIVLIFVSRLLQAVAFTEPHWRSDYAISTFRPDFLQPVGYH